MILISAGFFGFSIYKNQKIIAASKTYAEGSIRAISLNWTKEELIQRSSPELFKEIHDKSADFDKLFLEFAKLGPLKKISMLETETTVNFNNDQNGSATYKAQCQFEHGEATVKIRVLLRGDEWRIFFFNITSPVFQTNSGT